jgi:Cyanobacterial TRADD-N associated 2-Transmembrane domain
VEKRKVLIPFLVWLSSVLGLVGLLALALLPKSMISAELGSLLSAALIVSAFAGVFYAISQKTTQVTQETRERIERIEVKAEKEPEKAKFAWELASAKLEAYFDRNLSQVFAIFTVAIFVMLVGFGFVLWGVWLAIKAPGQNTAWIAAISGIITEFIGVTFMVIYRSTMAQASSFMQVLERMNTVGMAVQILDSIPDTDSQLKNSTRAELVSLLFKGAAETKK